MQPSFEQSAYPAPGAPEAVCPPANANGAASSDTVPPLAPAAAAAAAAAALASPPCIPYRKVVQRAVGRTKPPQLSREQLLWIAESVHGKAAAHSGGDPRLLVFGVRFDSGDWVAVNCRGRTVFLEHAAAWMAKANKKNELEVRGAPRTGACGDRCAVVAWERQAAAGPAGCRGALL